MNEPWDSGPIDPRMGIICDPDRGRSPWRKPLFPIHQEDLEQVKIEVLNSLKSGPKAVSDIIGWVFGRVRLEADAPSAWALYYNVTQHALRELSSGDAVKTTRRGKDRLWILASI